MRRTLHIRLSAESGFWNTICMARTAAVRRSPAVAFMAVPSRVISPPSSRAWIPTRTLAKVLLPEPGLADEAKRLTPGESEVDGHEGGNILAPLTECLGDIGELDDGLVPHPTLDGAGWWFGNVGDLVGVVAASEVPAAHVDNRRHFGVTEVVGQDAPIDVDTEGQRRADLGKVAGDCEQRSFGLAQTLAGDAVEQTNGVGVFWLVEDF